MALYTGFTICQPENSWIDHRHWQAEGVVLPPCLIIDPASLPDSPFRDFVVIAFIRGWKSQPYCFHRFCWYVFFPWWWALLFFFQRGDVGETIRLDFSKNNCIDRCSLGWFKKWELLAHRLPKWQYIPIYIFLSYHIFYPIFYWLHCLYNNRWAFMMLPQATFVSSFNQEVVLQNSPKNVVASGATSQRSSSFWMCWRRDAFGLLEDRKKQTLAGSRGILTCKLHVWKFQMLRLGGVHVTVWVDWFVGGGGRILAGWQDNLLMKRINPTW